METKLERDVRFLKIYAVVVTIACAVFSLTAFAAQDKKQKLTEIDVERGKRRDNSTMLLISDVKGRPRTRLQVTPEGTPKLEFMDEAGKVLYSLPDAANAPKP